LSLYRLRDGYICLAQPGEEKGLTARICGPEGGDEFEFSLEPALVPLFLGGSGALPAHPIAGELVRRGLVVPADRALDPAVRGRLAALDEHFAYAWRDDVARDDRLRRSYELLLDAHSARKLMRFDLGQMPLVPFSILKRVQLIDRQGPNLRVLLIGDDDLAGLPLALLGHDVTVVDLDDGLLTFIGGQAAGLGLSIELVHQDVSASFPAGLGGRFDAFYADPVTNLQSLRACLHRGLACLRPGGRGYLSVDSDIAGWAGRELEAAGVGGVQLLKRFNHYYSPDSFQLEELSEDLHVFAREGGAAPLPLAEPIRVDAVDPASRLEVKLDLFRCRHLPSPREVQALLGELYGRKGLRFVVQEAADGQSAVLLAISPLAVIVVCLDRATSFLGLDFKPLTRPYEYHLGNRLQELAQAEKYGFSYSLRLPEAN
jgi:hypothetical protein